VYRVTRNIYQCRLIGTTERDGASNHTAVRHRRHTHTAVFQTGEPQINRYCNSLRVGRSGDRIPVRAGPDFLLPFIPTLGLIQSTARLSNEGRTAGAWRSQRTPQLVPIIKRRAKSLSLHTGPSWPVLGSIAFTKPHMGLDTSTTDGCHGNTTLNLPHNRNIALLYGRRPTAVPIHADPTHGPSTEQRISNFVSS
jgi:hypothetical protein